MENVEREKVLLLAAVRGFAERISETLQPFSLLCSSLAFVAQREKVDELFQENIIIAKKIAIKDYIKFRSRISLSD